MDQFSKEKLEPGKAIAESRRIYQEHMRALLTEYIGIPNLSPEFDPRDPKGHTERAVQLFVRYAEEQKKFFRNEGKDVKISVERRPGGSPLILITAPGDLPGNTLIYGHLDKQPPGEGWSEGLGPYTPVEKDGKLYGRGAADDGYALPASLASIRILDQQGVPRPTCTVIIESGEESGSPDMPFYLDLIEKRLEERKIERPTTVICLDSGAGDYEHLWQTSSLRGVANMTVEVRTADNPAHSGERSGLLADPFRIVRDLLSRIEDPKTGEVILPELSIEIPEERMKEIEIAAPILAEEIRKNQKRPEGVGLTTDDPKELVIRNTWKATLTVVGIDGLPSVDKAGNVQQPRLRLKLSVRIPPGVNAVEAAAALKRALESASLDGARVSVEIIGTPGNGWDAPAQSPKLKEAIEESAETYFGGQLMALGEGGSIPLMNELQKRFPGAQFLVTGVLGPGSNAHGPDESLDIGYTVDKLIPALAAIIAESGK